MHNTHTSASRLRPPQPAQPQALDGEMMPTTHPTPADLPRALCNVQALAADIPAAQTGAIWRLQEPGRQLDANLVHLSPSRRVDTHAEPDLDVLLLVIAGDGTLSTQVGHQPLVPGALIWLPHGSSRSLAAGDHGLAYVTVHRRRSGLQIRRQGQ
jgi:quercetin dioxygenase-like cupin family protein